MDINFYNVDLKYIEFLKKYETEHRGFTRVPNVNYHSGNNKFFYGTVLNVNDINYFVPVSSKVHSKQDDLLIRAKNRPELIYGTLRFAYMLPIPKECLSLLIRDELKDSQKSLKIKNELAFCRRNKDKIARQAEYTYERIVSSISENLTHNSCDFKLLEQAYIEYCIENKLECSQINVQDYVLKKLNEIYADFINNTSIDNSVHKDFTLQYGELPQTLDTAENRGNVSKYIVEQIDKGELTETQKKALEDLKQAITYFEEPLFPERVNDIAKWANKVIEKAKERNTGLDEQEKDSNAR